MVFWQFLLVQIVLTAAFSKITDSVYVKIPEGFLPKSFFFIMSLKWTRSKRGEGTKKDRGNNTFWKTDKEYSLTFDWEYLLIGQPVLSCNNHKELLYSPAGSKTKKPINMGLWAQNFLLRWCKGKTLRLLNAVLLFCSQLIPKKCLFYFWLCDLTGVPLLIF